MATAATICAGMGVTGQGCLVTSRTHLKTPTISRGGLKDTCKGIHWVPNTERSLRALLDSGYYPPNLTSKKFYAMTA